MPDSLPDPAATAALAAERVLILDFGSQVTQLIARRLRESASIAKSGRSTPIPARIAAWRPRGDHPVRRAGQPDRGRLAARAAGGIRGGRAGARHLLRHADDVRPAGRRGAGSDHREFGRAFVDLVDDCVLFQGVWHKGGARAGVDEPRRPGHAPAAGVPRGGVSEGAPFAAIADDARKFYGLLFHPEVVHTPHGAALLRNFTHGVLGLSGTWTMAGFRATEIARIRARGGAGAG